MKQVVEKIMRKCGWGKTVRKNNEVAVERTLVNYSLTFMMMARIECKKKSKRNTLAQL
jgi:hypothetical protein